MQATPGSVASRAMSMRARRGSSCPLPHRLTARTTSWLLKAQHMHPSPLAAWLSMRTSRIGPQLAIVKHEVDCIEAEAIDAAIEPEPRDLNQGCDDLVIVEIELRLTGKEVMQVVLAPTHIPGPGAAAEYGEPVVRRR